MINKYYIVDKSILPDSYEKVIQARKLIDTGEVTQVSEATKKKSVLVEEPIINIKI